MEEDTHASSQYSLWLRKSDSWNLTWNWGWYNGMWIEMSRLDKHFSTTKHVRPSEKDRENKNEKINIALKCFDHVPHIVKPKIQKQMFL